VVESARPILLFPLAVELAALHTSWQSRCELHCCGPGASAIKRWFTTHQPEAGRVIVLAGVAGGLNPALHAGEARIISTVIDDETRYTPTLLETAQMDALPTASITTSKVALTSVAAKKTLAAQTGADLVDQESLAFAQCATQARCRWMIVRGVSDDAQTALPEGIDRWVDELGRTRLHSVLWAVLRSPRMVRELKHLQAATNLAMANNSALLDRILGPIIPAYSGG